MAKYGVCVSVKSLGSTPAHMLYLTDLAAKNLQNGIDVLIVDTWTTDKKKAAKLNTLNKAESVMLLLPSTHMDGLNLPKVCGL